LGNPQIKDPNKIFIHSVADPGFDLRGGVDFVNGGEGA